MTPDNIPAASVDSDTLNEVADERQSKIAEKEAVTEAGHMSAKLVYFVVMREGRTELSRPTASLIWSGLAAGLCIGFSVLGESIFRAYLPDAPWRHLLENLGYSLGFLLVILGRMQLFTENTITTVLPLMTDPSTKMGWAVARLWTIVLAANIVGCFIGAAFLAWTPAVPPEVLAAMTELSHHATSAPAFEAFFKAIPAGILIAALVWMLSAGDHGGGFWVILTFTWLIAAGDFAHIVAGSVEMAFLILSGGLGVGPAVLGFFLPVLAGNVVGGTVVFTLLAWGQVKEEVQPGGPAWKHRRQ